MTKETKFNPGQRWISDTESDLGMGLVSSVDGRMVTVIFPASEERRTYAINNAPLSRVRLNVGQHAQSVDHWEIVINQVNEENGILIYKGNRSDTGEPAELLETQLNSFIQIADAQSRLLHGQIDTNKWFNLRVSSRTTLDRVHALKSYGLGGARISLIPHQLFIAQEIGDRFAPRALLADEVGLGKTIEACLILHKQLLTGRVQRVLIMVPESLLHQWLVELLRRFNLRFKLFDEDRCQAAQETDAQTNPFNTEQLILSPISLFDSTQRQEEALAATWDLVIIDEAHHIQWHPHSPSSTYRFVENLAGSTPGLLLLTGTPEQLGEASHFARLRLLDSDRFTDFNEFLQEQYDYREISKVVDAMMSSGSTLPPATLALVSQLLQEGTAAVGKSEHTVLIKKLIDRHGPSRVLFRNTRSNIKGFPRRVLHAEPLASPHEYRNRPDSSGVEKALYPEVAQPGEWTVIDPRVKRLVEMLERLKPEKVVLICARSNTVVDLERALRTRFGIRAAVFHENMSVVARDRAAHFFADREGARLLLCSEIGSEGRNFQFAHHLILFDLPLLPDLLEQRIGRLDRIGQCEDIQLHTLYLQSSAQQIMFNWYHEGLNAFVQTCPVGQSVYQEVEQDLLGALLSGEGCAKLIENTRSLYQQKSKILQQGRDRLLEISSFDQDAARGIIESIEETEKEHLVIDLFEKIFDMYGVEFEDRHEKTYIVRPSEHMHTPHFPYLRSDGMTVTFDRATALAHEDVEYLSWEHPMTQGAMDLVLTSDHGKAVVIGADFDLLPRGSILVETTHVLEIIAPNAAELRRFVGKTVCQLLRDEVGRDLRSLIGSQKLMQKTQDIDSTTARKIIHMKREQIVSVIEQNEQEAKAVFTRALDKGQRRLDSEIEQELQRLRHLQSMHASVREEELTLRHKQRQRSLKNLKQAQSKLDAVRLIVTL